MNERVSRAKEYLFRIKELVLVFVIGFVLTFYLYWDGMVLYKGTYIIDQNTGVLIILVWPVMFVLMIVIQFLMDTKR